MIKNFLDNPNNKPIFARSGLSSLSYQIAKRERLFRLTLNGIHRHLVKNGCAYLLRSQFSSQTLLIPF
jgi:hypothetical protein